MHETLHDEVSILGLILVDLGQPLRLFFLAYEAFAHIKALLTHGF